MSIIGKAQYKKLSESRWHTLEINQKLNENYRIRSWKGSKVILILDDGSKYTLRNIVVLDINKLNVTKNDTQSSLKLFYGKYFLVVLMFLGWLLERNSNPLHAWVWAKCVTATLSRNNKVYLIREASQDHSGCKERFLKYSHWYHRGFLL